MLLAVVFLLIEVQTRNVQKTTIYQEKALEILRGVEMNVTLRSEIVSENTLPINSSNPSFPPLLKSYLVENNLRTANCSLQICAPSDTCLLSLGQGAVYSKEILITSTKGSYNPRKLKIFCLKQ